MIRITLLIASLIIISAAEVRAEIYKWVDDKGKTHYGDKPVASSKKMDIKEEHSISKNISQSERENRRNKLIETFDIERKEKKKKQAKERKKKARLNAQCGRSKDRLRRYKRAGSMYDVDKDGKRIYLPDNIRQLEINKLQKQIKKHCK